MKSCTTCDYLKIACSSCVEYSNFKNDEVQAKVQEIAEVIAFQLEVVKSNLTSLEHNSINLFIDNSTLKDENSILREIIADAINELSVFCPDYRVVFEKRIPARQEGQ